MPVLFAMLSMQPGADCLSMGVCPRGASVVAAYRRMVVSGMEAVKTAMRHY